MLNIRINVKIIISIIISPLFFIPIASAEDPYPNVTGEFLWGGGLLQIGAHKAYDQGITGAGVTIAVLDTGVNYLHPELFPQMAVGGFDFYDGEFDYMDYNGHGTLVAGIIAAKKDDYGIHGVAYNSKILPIKISNDDASDYSIDALNWGLYHAIQEGAPVVNFSGSIGQEDGFIIDDYTADAGLALAYTALGGTIVVASAGNTSAPNPIFPALLPYLKPENHDSGVYSFSTDLSASPDTLDFSYSEGLIIAVAAADPNGVISDFSNHCGVAAPWCITAPGEDIITTFWYDTYIRANGTSLSAPFVTGAIALLKEAFPNLTNRQLVELLLSTAKKDGIYADESIYGQGFLDIENAFSPQGYLNWVYGNGAVSSIPLEDSYIQGGGAFGDSFQGSLALQGILVSDKFDRQYSVSLANTVQTTRLLDWTQNEKVEFLRIDGKMYTQHLTDSLSFTSVPFESREGEELSDVAFSYKMGASKFRYSSGDATFLNEDQPQSVESLKQRLFQPAYLDMAGGGQAFAWEHELSPNFTFHTSWRDGSNIVQDDLNANAVTTEFHWKNNSKDTQLNFVSGFVTEEDSTLGMTSSGAFAVKSGSKTQFIGINSHILLAENTSILGSAYVGQTKAKAASESLVSNVSNISHQQATVGIEQRAILNDKDRVTLALALPLRVTEGSMKLNAFNVNGSNSSGIDIDLAAQSQAQDLHLFYDTPVLENTGHLGMQLTLSNNSGHVKNKQDSAFLLYTQIEF